MIAGPFYTNTAATIACDDHRPLLAGVKWVLEGWRPLDAMDAECARALSIAFGTMTADEPLCQTCRDRAREMRCRWLQNPVTSDAAGP